MNGLWTRVALGLVLAASSARAQEELDTDADGIPDAQEFAGDTDGDGTPNAQDDDDDGDTVPSLEESATRDLDGDGKLDYLDDDDDGDGVPTSFELGSGGSDNPRNTDGDWFPDHAPRFDYLDDDDDGDNVLTKDEVAAEGESPTAFDLDGDKVANYLDDDDDGDSLPTFQEVDFEAVSPHPQKYDSDGDKTPNYLDADDDNDDIPSLLEDRNDSGFLLDDLEVHDGEDGDELPGFLDPDDDNDSIPTRYELGAGGIASPRHSDNDGVPDYLDVDDDGDGISTYYERSTRKQPDTNNNGIPDYLEAGVDGSKAKPLPPKFEDADDDGVLNVDEALDPEEDFDTADLDDDGTPNMYDDDDDGDSVRTVYEFTAGGERKDTDQDGRSDYVDADDDGDTIPTLDEDPDPDGDGDPIDARETIEGIKDYLNPDDDGDGIPTADEVGPGGHEHPTDTNGDGTPDYRDPPVSTPGDGDGDGSGDGDGETGGDGDSAGDGDTAGDGDSAGDGDMGGPGGEPGPGGNSGDGDANGGITDGDPPSNGDDGCSAHPGANRSPFIWLFFALLVGLRSMRTRARARLNHLGALLFAFGLSACGDDASGPGSEPLGGGDGDRPSSDAGDGDSESDGAIESDAGTGTDTEKQCEVDPMELSIPIDDTGRSPWDLKLFGQSFQLVYQATTCDSPGMFQGLRQLSFLSTGAFGAPEDLVNMAEGVCTFSLSPVLGASAAGEPVVYYNAEGGELSRLEFGADAPQPFTMDVGTNDIEELTTWARFGQRELVAYVNSVRMSSNTYGQLVTREVGKDELSLIARSEERHFSALALKAFVSGKGALAWAADAPTGAIQLQLLDDMGAPQGASKALSDGGNTASSISLATRLTTDKRDVGAVVFAESSVGASEQRVVFRSFGADGALGSAVRIVSGGRDARDVDVAPFADGYVVAYRLLSGSGSPNPVIRLSFVSLEGRGPTGGGERTLTAASTSGGAVKVLTAPDGRLIVAFTDRTDDNRLLLRVVRANCLP